MSNPNNARIATYEDWLRRHKKRFKNPLQLVQYIESVGDTSENAFRFLIEQAKSQKKVWSKVKLLAEKKGEKLVMQATFLALTDNGLSKIKAIKKICEKYDKEESLVRKRLK